MLRHVLNYPENREVEASMMQRVISRNPPLTASSINDARRVTSLSPELRGGGSAQVSSAGTRPARASESALPLARIVGGPQSHYRKLGAATRSAGDLPRVTHCERGRARSRSIPCASERWTTRRP